MDTLPFHTQNDKPSIPATPGIYCIRSTVTSELYIGSTINLRKRCATHFRDLRNKKHKNYKLHRICVRHGIEALVFEVLEYILLPELLTSREQHWIDTLKPTLNIAPNAGSTLGLKPSIETRQKQSKARRGKPQSEEHKRKRAEATRGRVVKAQTRSRISAANKGRSHSPEEDMPKMKGLIITDPNGEEHHIFGIKRFCDTHKLNRSALIRVAKGEASQHKGYRARYPGDEQTQHRLRVKAPRKGHPLSETSRAKIGAAHRGMKHTLEARAKMSKAHEGKCPHAAHEANRKTLLFIDPDGKEYLVHGINDFCKANGLDSSCITKVANGKHSQHRGWRVRYPDAAIEI